MQTFSVKTGRREELVNITDEVRRIAAASGIQEGAVIVFCPHTTGGITINEAADPDVARDITVNLTRFIPRHGDYRHAEGNSDAHIKSSLVGSSVTIIVSGGRLKLGTWQGVYFTEFDGPRDRQVWVQTIGN